MTSGFPYYLKGVNHEAFTIICQHYTYWRFYGDFTQVEDDEVVNILREFA